MRMMRLVVWGAILATATLANALPVELRDQNNSRYFINTDVTPFENISNASGALTNATYVKPVTVTSYYIGFTPFFGFATVSALAQLDSAVGRGLAVPSLLDDNDDFASLRATPEWGPLMARVQAAAILHPPRH